MKKILATVFSLALSAPSFSAGQFDQSIEEMLERYNYTKDITIVSVVLVRCAALLNITNSIQETPETVKVDPHKLFTSAIQMRSKNPGQADVSTVIEEFRTNSKEYQDWFKTASEAAGNPFDSPALKKEFQICDESAREFLNI